MTWKLEDHLNDWVKSEFARLKLQNQRDYYTESAIPDYLKEALRGHAKTENKTNFGKPDFALLKKDGKIPVLIENKLGVKKLAALGKDGKVRFDEKSIRDYAVNGALHYATGVMASQKYKECIAIGVAGDSPENVEIRVYYVFGSGHSAFKKLDGVKTLDFLENPETFEVFYKNATLTEGEKHRILIDSREELKKQAKALNRLMHSHAITVHHRVLYVSGMLLAMQEVEGSGDRQEIQDGLKPEDLKGSQLGSKRDGVLIYNQIKEFLTARRNIPEDKRNLMLASFSEISKDAQRDEKTKLDKAVAKFLQGDASPNKQIFTFIYESIFKRIDQTAGHLDIMGEMYSEFLKYALGDGKELGIVLTPPYVTKMMAEILDVDQNSRVMDLATGSAGFLISAMKIMESDVEAMYGRGTTAAERKIRAIKGDQLLGIELDAQMFTLAATNMIMRGDGSARIEKGSAFNRPEKLFADFKADKLLLNPPFSHEENGMPFIAFGLDKMAPGGYGAIIIQDSAGSGKAVKTNRRILKKHTLKASIKMPVDLFVPMAGVQTSIYIFEAHRPHDFEKTVRFIDFRHDGYKRTSRSLQEVDEPGKRYEDIVKIYKAGRSAKVAAKWDLDAAYIEDFISDSGSDWNFDQHRKISARPGFDDFRKNVADYLAWQVQQVLKGDPGGGDSRLGK